MRIALCAMALGGLVLLAGGGARAADAPFSYQGTWKLNTAESKYPPGFPDIHDHVITVAKDDGNILQYTDNFTIGDQPPTHVSYDGAYDGKLRKTSDGQVIAFYHTKTGYRDHYKAPNGTKGKDKCDFSGDGNRLTCHGWFISPGAKDPVRFVEVWDKAQ